MVNSKTSPWGTPSFAAISGAGLWVGPIMKFPSSFAEGMSPSGKSLALTYPGVFGSRVGAGGRAPLAAFAGACLSGGLWAGVWAIAGPKPAIRQIKNALVGTPNMQNSFPPILTYPASTHLGQPGGSGFRLQPVISSRAAWQATHEPASASWIRRRFA